MDDANKGLERVTSDKALSCSFNSPVVERMIIKPQAVEVVGNRAEAVPDTIHIAFKHESDLLSPMVKELRGSFDDHARVDGKTLLLTAKDGVVTKDMVHKALLILHVNKVITLDDAGKAAEAFGVDGPVIQIGNVEYFREREFQKAKDIKGKIINPHREGHDPSGGMVR